MRVRRTLLLTLVIALVTMLAVPTAFAKKPDKPGKPSGEEPVTEEAPPWQFEGYLMEYEPAIPLGLETLNSLFLEAFSGTWKGKGETRVADVVRIRAGDGECGPDLDDVFPENKYGLLCRSWMWEDSITLPEGSIVITDDGDELWGSLIASVAVDGRYETAPVKEAIDEYGNLYYQRVGDPVVEDIVSELTLSMSWTTFESEREHGNITISVHEATFNGLDMGLPDGEGAGYGAASCPVKMRVTHTFDA